MEIIFWCSTKCICISFWSGPKLFDQSKIFWDLWKDESSRMWVTFVNQSNFFSKMWASHFEKSRLVQNSSKMSKNFDQKSKYVKFSFSEKATKMCAIALMVLKFTYLFSDVNSSLLYPNLWQKGIIYYKYISYRNTHL